jgi:hypothetical protein
MAVMAPRADLGGRLGVGMVMAVGAGVGVDGGDRQRPAARPMIRARKGLVIGSLVSASNRGSRRFLHP